MIICSIIFILLNSNKLLYNKTQNGIYVVIKDDNTDNKLLLLSQIINNMYRLKNHLITNISKFTDYNEFIILLDKNFNTVRTFIYESDYSKPVTSFSINKGEELSLCLRSKNTGKLHDINLLMYIAIHEMAHFACPEIGHGPLFIKIFKKFIEEAIRIGIYKYENYNINNIEYCGILLNSSII